MNVYHHVGPLDVLNDGMSRLFGHSTLRIAREDAVHVEVEVGDTPLNGVDTQRIESGIDFQCTIEGIDMFRSNTGQFITYHLPFQFVAMGACYHTKAQAVLPAVLNNILADAELLVDGKFC